jgi:hypothetical protein
MFWRRCWCCVVTLVTLWPCVFNVLAVTALPIGERATGRAIHTSPCHGLFALTALFAQPNSLHLHSEGSTSLGSPSLFHLGGNWGYPSVHEIGNWACSDEIIDWRTLAERAALKSPSGATGVY